MPKILYTCFDKSTVRVGHCLIDTIKKFMSVGIRHECAISNMMDHSLCSWFIMLEILHSWRI